MKTIWKGSLSFGLVTIPIRLYSAIQEHAISFTLLCKKCHMPITYERWCKGCNKEVAWQDVVKGLRLEDGSYFILTQEKLRALKPETTDTISIVEFVSATQIQPIYLEHHYYLAPDKENEQAFFLFKKALEVSGKVAIGTFVMRDKQYACVINPYEKIMLLSTLNYSYEIRDINEVPYAKNVPKKLESAELKLAAQLIDQLTAKKFNLAQFKDTFAQQLKAAIKKGKREKGVSRKRTGPAVEKKKEKNKTLIANLRASLIAPGRGGEVAHARGKKRR